MPEQPSEQSTLSARLDLYASIVASSAEAIVTIDLDGIVTSWNAAAEQVYGQAAADVLGRSLYTLIDPSLATATRANVERIRLGETFKLPDAHWTGPDGRTEHIAVSLSPVLDASGKVTGVACFGRNIAQRKRAEHDLRIAAAKYAALFDTAPVAISVADDTGRLVEGNRAAEQILGLPAHDIRQRTYYAPEWRVIRPDGSPMPPAEFASVRAVAEQQRIDNVEMGIVHADGEVRWIAVNAAPLDLPGYQVIASYVDITERKNMENAVRDSEERLRLIVQNSPDVIARFDEGARLSFVSEGVHKLLGQSPDELLAREAAAAAAPAATASAWNALRSVVEACLADPHVRRSLTFTMRSGDGRDLRLEAHFQGYVLGSGSHEVVCVVHDMTDHLALQAAVENANRSLEARVAERTAALEDAVVALERANAGKDAFLAAVSHELRTPLTGILSVAEVLHSQIRGELNEHQLRYVETIEASGQRLQATIDNILAYTRAMSTDGPPALGLCSLADVATQALRAINPKASRKQLAVQLGMPADLDATIVSDGEAILRVLIALLDNAVKFTPAGGQVGLDITPRSQAGTAELVVWDTGIGLDPEQAGSLFDAFAQGDQSLGRRYEGLGLGLAYVQRKLEVLGGSIGVEPNTPAGTRVTVRVPSR